VAWKLKFEGRMKHLYSVYTKMLTQNKTIDEIFDLMGLRIILNTEEECYVTLGLVHAVWPPIPGRLKDYICFTETKLLSEFTYYRHRS